MEWAMVHPWEILGLWKFQGKGTFVSLSQGKPQKQQWVNSNLNQQYCWHKRALICVCVSCLGKGFGHSACQSHQCHCLSLICCPTPTLPISPIHSTPFHCAGFACSGRPPDDRQPHQEGSALPTTVARPHTVAKHFLQIWCKFHRPSLGLGHEFYSFWASKLETFPAT